MTDQTFEGRVVLVTGGGTGIGAGISTLFARRGASVIICQPTHEEAQDCAASLFLQEQVAVEAIGSDLSSADGCRRLIDTCVQRHSRIDVLVNNAAITGPPAVGDFFEFPDTQLDAIVDVNLKAPFRCSRHAAQHMRRQGSGVIVNIASVGAYAAQHRATAYVASKAGVTGLTRGMAFELAPHGIRVVAVAPGDIDLEPASDGALGNPYDLQSREWWTRRAVLGRRGSPRDVALAIAFLASDEASYITGETLLVDGGWLAY